MLLTKESLDQLLAVAVYTLREALTPMIGQEVTPEEVTKAVAEFHQKLNTTLH
jgi:hypothetical protein